MIQIDMPMPGCCASCRFRDPDYCYCHADYDGRVVNNKKTREEWCPLKNVSQGKQEEKPIQEKASSLEYYTLVPFPICAKCPNLSPKLIYDPKLYGNTLRIICTNADICITLVKMKNEEVKADDQSQPNENTDLL